MLSLIISCLLWLLLARIGLSILWETFKEIMPNDWARKYGVEKGKWAIVTGATDGVGLGFVEFLAEQGCNLVMISRSQEKLQRRIREIQSDLQKRKREMPRFIYIVADFRDCAKEGFVGEILRQIQGLDISLLVNNVGTSDIKPISNSTPEQIANIINVNCLSMALLTSAIAPILSREGSAIINLSSILGELPAPYVSLYSSTKAFNTFFSESVSMERELSHIDILAVRPWFVVSPLSRAKEGFFVPSAKACARACIRELKWEYESNGYFIHRIMSIFARMAPKFLTRMIGKSRIAQSLMGIERKHK